MSATFFSADTHLLHKMVAGLRGFATSEEHDEAVIGKWNRLIHPDDLVWHLGDVGLGNETRVLEQAARLHGRKQLITGNHDPCWPGHRDSRKHQRRWLDVFESVQAFARIRIDGRNVLLSHFPYEGDHTGEDRAIQYRLRDEGLWLLHGHTHSKERRTPPTPTECFFCGADLVKAACDDHHQVVSRQIHVGLDAWNLMPVSEADVLGVIRGCEESMADVAA